MALSKASVKKAVSIFKKIVVELKSTSVIKRDQDNQYDDQKIIGIDKKADGGWENLFINIKNISQEQMQLWDKRKAEIRNSNFCHEVQTGVTRIGFF